MDNLDLLELCLKITGSFENTFPRYDALTGSADGQGASIGVCQWNFGQGTAQEFLKQVLARNPPPPIILSLGDLTALSKMPPLQAVAFVKNHYLDEKGQFTPSATVGWKAFLLSPDSLAVQRSMAEANILQPALKLAAKYMPEAANRTRVAAFFFDVITQEGSMRTIQPVQSVVPADLSNALNYAKGKDSACAALWAKAVIGDQVASKLLYYAYERSVMGLTSYIWDSLSRRGSIACRVGIVHGSPVDLTKVLD